MAEADACSICADELDGTQNVTLECGHSFHVACALRWFRYEHTTCPNCRSSHTQQVWARRTPAQRIAAMRRQRNLPAPLRAKLRQLDRAHVRWSATRAERRAVRADNTDVFRRERRLARAEGSSRAKYRSLLHSIAWLSAPNVPFLTYSGNVSASETGSEAGSEESETEEVDAGGGDGDDAAQLLRSA